MKFLKPVLCVLAALATTAYAQTKAMPNVEFEMMTWVEVKQAFAQGKTTALVLNGGTEQRGTQCVNGGHNIMAKAVAIAMAQKLGNALVAPTLPFSPNNASADLPGTIGLTSELYAAMNEQVAEQLIKTGFKNVVLMGDHGGGQQQLGEVAKKLDAKYASQGIRVIYVSDVYQKANADFDKYLEAHNLPISSHAGTPDTSMLLYLSTLGGGDKGYVRKELIASAVGTPVPARGSGGRAGRGAADAGGRGGRGRGEIGNGISGDARPSTVELGKIVFDMHVDEGVSQIKQLLGGASAQH